MALTGIQIFKLLPKTNCKECGVPTCLAFAMNLASGKAELDSCPYVSDEAREQLAEASAPPIRPVVVGAGVRKATTGGETVQYRHEKTFYNPTLHRCPDRHSDIAAADALADKLKAVECVAVRTGGLQPSPRTGGRERRQRRRCDAFAAVAKQVAESSEFNVVLMSDRRRRHDGRRGSLWLSNGP
jgi:acetyl-CoA decarbonylase/synthase complex subunit gamma